ILPNQETEPHWPPDPAGNPITAIPCDDTVKLGMCYDPETGEFSEYIPPEPEPQPTPEPTQLDRIEEQIAALTADSLTVSSVEAAILEGVNDV
ncbi:MAG: hypothetical protein ACI4AO_02810, partial [Anaerotignum sp.]